MKKQASKKAALSPAKSKTAAKLRARQLPAPNVSADVLLTDIRELIAGAKTRVAQAVNTGQLLLNWHIGNRIRTDILGEKRADYGEQIVQTLSAQLMMEYGSGYTRTALARMIQFAEQFPNVEIVATLSQQLGWSHFVEIIRLKDDLKRDFYAEMCRIERWSVRALLEAKLNEAIKFSRAQIRETQND